MSRKHHLLPRIFTTPTFRISAVAVVVLTATVFGSAAQAAEATPVAAVSDPSWSNLPRVKENDRVAATQARLLRDDLRKLDTDLTAARETAQAATATLVNAEFALPQPAAVEPSAEPTTDEATTVAFTKAAPEPSFILEPAKPEATVASADTAPINAPAPTPEQVYAEAAEAKKTADDTLADRELEAAEKQAQIQYLTTAEADATKLRDRAIETAERKVETEAAQRLATEKERKAAEEAARIAAEEAARVAAEEAARQAFLNRWTNPATGGISDTYGPRAVICAGNGCSSPFHGGTDVATGCDAPIYAAHAGTVTSASPSGTLGNYVTIDNGGAVTTGYGHLTAFNVGAGQPVAAGDLIGWSGNTGASTGCHLHFEVSVGGGKTDPIPFLAERGSGIG